MSRSAPAAARAALAIGVAGWATLAIGVAARAALAIGVVGVAGCAALVPKIEAPQLSVVDVRMLDAQLMEQRFNVRLRVQNPNDRELPIRGLSYTMRLADQDFGRGQSAKAFTVPAFGEAEFDMVVTTNLAAGLLRILPQIERDPSKIEYRIEGRVATDLPFLKSVPFVEQGTLPLR